MGRPCKGCTADITHKHSNAKFCTKKCKDLFHNWNNPRGKFAHLKDLDDEDMDREGHEAQEAGWDGHKNTW